MTRSVTDWTLFLCIFELQHHFNMVYIKVKRALDNKPSFSPLQRPRFRLCNKEGKLGVCHGWPTKQGRLDKFFRNEKKVRASNQTCLTYSLGTSVVVIVIEYLQLWHTKWGTLLHYSVYLLLNFLTDAAVSVHAAVIVQWYYYLPPVFHENKMIALPCWSTSKLSNRCGCCTNW